MIYGTFFHVIEKPICASESFSLSFSSILFPSCLWGSCAWPAGPGQTSNVPRWRERTQTGSEETFYPFLCLWSNFSTLQMVKRRQRHSMTHQVALFVGAMEAFSEEKAQDVGAKLLMMRLTGERHTSHTVVLVRQNQQAAGISLTPTSWEFTPHRWAMEGFNQPEPTSLPVICSKVQLNVCRVLVQLKLLIQLISGSVVNQSQSNYILIK